jgi:hypothetical protein
MSAVGLSVPELFQVKPPDDPSKAYRNLFEARSGRAAQARAFCDDIWRDSHDLADLRFLERFPFEFHRRWFEMYLGGSLRRVGLHVEAPKPGPDLRVTLEGRPIYIEAVAPTGGNSWHADSVQEPIYRADDGTRRAVQVPPAETTKANLRQPAGSPKGQL